MDEKLLEIREYKDEGFKPLIYFQSWRVAVLNYLDSLQPQNIHAVERHPETDEVFVLLRGESTLIIGEGEPQVEKLYVQVMEPGAIYNVKPQTWHAVVLSRDASILIVENADTGEHNSQFSELRTEQRQFILDAVIQKY